MKKMLLAPWAERWLETARNNIWLKGFSFVVATGLYLFINGTETAQRTFNVGLVSLMPPESANRKLLEPPPVQLSVTIRGPRAQLDALRSDDLGSVQLDLRSGTGETKDLLAEMVHVPPGLKVEQIYPPSIPLHWDDVVERLVAVQVPRTGDPAAGMSLVGAIHPDPQMVTARGPKSVIETMQSIRTAPFDVSGLPEGEAKKSLLLERTPEAVQVTPVEVVATAEIGRETIRKEFSGIMVHVVGLPRATVLPPTITVAVVGPAESVNAVQRDSLVARVELSKESLDLKKPGSTMAEVVLSLPNLKVDLRPNKVLVRW